KTLFFIILFIFIYLILYLYPQEASIKRIFDFASYKGGSMRTVICENAWNLFAKYTLFGAGWGASYGYNGYFKMTHNTFLSILSDGGIIGLLLFLTPLIWCVIESWKREKNLPIIFL